MFGYTLKPNNYRYLENFTIFFPPHLRRLKTYKIISFSIFKKNLNFVYWRNFANKCFWDFWTDFGISNLGGVWCQVTAGRGGGRRRTWRRSFSASSLSSLFGLAGWRRRLHSIGEEHRICLEALGADSAFCGFFFFLNFPKKKFRWTFCTIFTI